jgi:hypothetical protein
MKLIHYISGFLKSDTAQSLMRFCTLVLCMVAAFHILVLTISNQWLIAHGHGADCRTIDWTGIGAFVGLVLFNKALQNFSETQNKNNQTPS